MPHNDTPAIFVTGAASGIGRATARLFASRGWFVGLYDTDAVGLKALAKEIGKGKCHTQALDVADAAAYSKAVSAFAKQSSGRMDVLFNCAGILRCGRFEDISLKDYELILRVNVMGVVTGIRASLDLLKKTPGARIINMSSGSAIYGLPEETVYSASKFAVRALTEALDIEFERFGITVSDIMPPVINTPMVRNQKFNPAVNKNTAWLDAENIADVVWQAAHQHRIHWIVGLEQQALSTLYGIFPFLGRMLMKQVTTHR